MQTRSSGRSALFVAGLFAAASAVASEAPAAEPALRASITIDAATRIQRIDGFGVNVTPAQWRGGALKPTLDLLVDDLGTSLVRLDLLRQGRLARPGQARRRRPLAGGVPRRRLPQPGVRGVLGHVPPPDREGRRRHLNVSGRVPAA